MTTDTKALIAEALAWTIDWDGSQMQDGEPPRDGVTCNLLRRLAAALEEATPPEGWRVTRYDHPLGAIEYDEGGWHVGRYVADQVYIAWDANTYPTARAAMEALEK